MTNPVGAPRRIFLEVGQPFGEGKVIEPDIGVTRPRKARLLCSCGTEYVAQIGNLVSGNTKSCGCLKVKPDGPSHHPLWRTWHAMIYRCENPKVKSYPRYGGRGIKVCPEWHDFAVFTADIERLLGPRPVGCTLDRKNNDGNYEPGNVRWATRIVQASNKSNPQRKVSAEDLAVCLVRWDAGRGESVSALARELGVHNSVLNRRLHKLAGHDERNGKIWAGQSGLTAGGTGTSATASPRDATTPAAPRT